MMHARSLGLFMARKGGEDEMRDGVNCVALGSRE